jgi:CBS domain-containing protein
MTIASILVSQPKPPGMVASDDSVKHAAQLMTRERVVAVMVSNDGVRLIGMISEPDIIRAVAERGAGIMEGPVAGVMRREIAACNPGDRVAAVLAAMHARKARHMPVVVDGAIVGLVSARELVARTLEQNPRAAELAVVRRFAGAEPAAEPASRPAGVPPGGAMPDSFLRSISW